MIQNNYLLFMILILIAYISIYLENHYTLAKKISGCIIALLLAMILSNTNIIPLDALAYDFVWDYVLPFSLPFLLWQANIHKILKASGRMTVIFLLSSLGTVIGACIAYTLLKDEILEAYKVAGMMIGTYVGGSMNLVAIASAFKVDQNILSSGIVADNLLMVLYFFVLSALPGIRFFKDHFNHYRQEITDTKEHIQYSLTITRILKASILSLIIVFVSFQLSNILANRIPETNAITAVFHILFSSKYIWITTLSVLFVSLFPSFVEELEDTKKIGNFLIHIFFAVIGVPASILLIIQKAPILFVFNFIIVFTNMLISFTSGKLLHFSLEEIAVASNANIGGPTTAAAFANSKGWNDLVIPSILTGTLGYVIGNYLGILIASLLK